MLADIRTLALVTVAAMTAVSTAAPASAAPADNDTRSRVVSYADLDLDSDADVARLDQRVRVALGAVCGNPDMRDLAARTRMIECRRIATDAARANVEVAVASARSGTRLALSTPARADAR